jgi:NADPH:quinone reductase-like Zn-dependent oxidoreductase
MNDMRAIVITTPGGPEVLQEQALPIPQATNDTMVLRVRAFGLNHAEAYFRTGVWGEVAKVSGIECVGEVHEPGGSKLRKVQRGPRIKVACCVNKGLMSGWWALLWAISTPPRTSLAAVFRPC